MFRPLSLAVLLGLSLCGLAQAQGAPPEPAVRSPQGLVAQERPADAQRPRRAARTARPQRRIVRQPEDHRSAAYPGGRGSSWRTGRDSYGFAGSLGGCRFRGKAGPNGYQLDRNC